MALPTDVALLDLLPAILRHAGSDLADEGVEHDGWVLQRLGKAPLDENRTPSELGLLDGETVHLRPRAASLPEIDFDDLVDGIAEQTRRRSDPWNERLSKWMLLAFGGGALLLGALSLLFNGPDAAVRAIVSGATAVLLVLTATAISRGKGDAVTATVLAFFAASYAGLSGWLILPAIDPSFGTAPGLASAGVLVVATLAIGFAGVGDSALLFVSALFAAVLLTVAAVIGATSPANSGQAAGIGLALTLIVLGIVPTSSFRLAGLTLPPLPTSSEEFSQDTDPVPHRVVVERTALADRYMTWLYIGLGGTSVVLLTVLIISATLWTMIMAGVASLLMLLRSRNIIGARQRWALLAPAGYAALINLVTLSTMLEGFVRLSVFGGAVVLALILLVSSASLPGRQLRPYWGRAVDILETLCALALIPLLLAVLNVYTLVRGMSG